MGARALQRRYGRAAKGGLKAVPPPGTKVRLTGTFLRNTGQARGGEGSKVWTVLGRGMSPSFVTVDEPYDDEYRRQMWGDLPEHERPKYRQIAIGNLQIVGTPPKAGDYP